MEGEQTKKRQTELCNSTVAKSEKKTLGIAPGGHYGKEGFSLHISMKVKEGKT